MLLSSLLVYFLRFKFNTNQVLKFLLVVATLNGVLVALQVAEQTVNNNFLPDILKYGGVWGFSGTHDYEIFKKGGIFPSTQTSSFLSLLICAYIVRERKSLWLLSPNILAVMFGGRTTVILAIIAIFFLLIIKIYRKLTKIKKNNHTTKIPLTWIFYTFIIIGFTSWWFNSPAGERHVFRLQQAFEVVVNLNFNDDKSGGSAFQFFKLPPDGIQVFIGNGLSRFHELGGNDPFYPRWLLQSGIFSLLILLIVFFVGFIVEVRNTTSLGIVTLMLLIQGFKGELLTSTFVFDFYLMYLFTKKRI